MSKTSELLQAIKNKSIPTKSELNLRNKDKAYRAKISRLSYLKKPKDKLAKLLFPTEFVAYLDPFTMEENETYNLNDAFRTEKTFTSTAMALKEFYNSNEEIKKKFLEYVGEESWDSSNLDEFTEEDKKVFSSFRELRLFTNDMVKINLPTLTKQPYPCDFLANYTRDELGDVVTEDGEYPKILEIQRLYRSVALEEFKEWKEANSAKSEADQKTQFRAVMGTCPIMPDIPVNVSLGIEIEVNNLWEPTKSLKSYKVEDVRNSAVIVKVNKDIKETIDSIVSKFITSDVDPDFFEIDMIVGSEDSAKERGQNTRYQLATKSLVPGANSSAEDKAKYKSFKGAFTEYFDTFEQLEASVKKATTFNVIDDNVVNNVFAALEIDKPLSSIERFITKEIAEKMGDIIDQIYGGSADEILVKAAVGELKDSAVTIEESEAFEADIRDILKEEEEISDFSYEVE